MNTYGYNRGLYLKKHIFLMLVKRAATDAVRACQVCVEVWAHAKGVYFPVWEY